MHRASMRLVTLRAAAQLCSTPIKHGKPCYQHDLAGAARLGQLRFASTTATAESVGYLGTSWKHWLMPAAVAVVAGVIISQQQSLSDYRQLVLPSTSQVQSTQHTSWVQTLSKQEHMLEVLSAEVLLADEHPVLKGDHMFTGFLHSGMVRDLRCYYDTEQKQFHSVVELGSGVCGYPGIVHGGLTAAVLDETLGFLLFALKKQGALPFWGPAFTAQLDVTYKQRLRPGVTVICTAEVERIEGRKVWMRAALLDRPGGTEYATARALFVAPRPHKLLGKGLRLVLEGLLPGSAQVRGDA